MVKRLFITCLFFLQNAYAEPYVIPNEPSIAAQSYILIDYYTGQILSSNNEHKQYPPASLTKIMTSYALGQELKKGFVSLDDEVTISKNAWAQNPLFNGSSVMWIEVGKTVRLADLEKGLIIQSGNDASVAIAEHIAGSASAYVDLMNAWAKNIGMENTYFQNVHGLDEEKQYTSAYDMALLTRRFIQDFPTIYAVYSEKEYTYNGIKQYNRNGLLWDTSLNVDGVKTGHTDEAGYSIVTSAYIDNMRLISVIIGANSIRQRELQSKKLLSYGFRFFETVRLYQKNDTFITNEIWFGNSKEVELGFDQDITLTIYRGQADNIVSSFEIHKTLEAPLKKGEEVGTIYFLLGDKEIASFPLVILNDVKKGSLFSQIYDYIHLLIRHIIE